MACKDAFKCSKSGIVIDDQGGLKNYGIYTLTNLDQDLIQPISKNNTDISKFTSFTVTYESKLRGKNNFFDRNWELENLDIVQWWKVIINL